MSVSAWWAGHCWEVFLSDPAIIGSAASLTLPFYASLVLVIISTILVLAFFKDKEIQKPREPFAFRPMEIFELLWRITRYPLVMSIDIHLPFERYNE